MAVTPGKGGGGGYALSTLDALIAWVKSLPQPCGAPAGGRVTRIN